MTVTTATIPLVSTYTVSDTGKFTTAIFNALKTDAEAILAVDDPGLSTVLYDRALALLICHLFTIRDPELGLSAFRSGDFSGNRVPGTTIYSLQYYALLAQGGYSALSLAEDDVLRSDADIGDMALDDSEIPLLYEEP